MPSTNTADPSPRVKLDNAGKLKNGCDNTVDPSPKVKMALGN
jgi:hypothetical protein